MGARHAPRPAARKPAVVAGAQTLLSIVNMRNPLSKVIAHELEILGSHGMQAHRYDAYSQ
jgi:hypothetical protein